MAQYNKTNWLDHVTEFPNRYTITDNADGTVTIQRANGNVVQEGTALSATHLNKIEQGLFDIFEEVGEGILPLRVNVIDLALEVETLKKGTLTGVNANMVVETFINLNDVTLANGKHDGTNQKIYLS